MKNMRIFMLTVTLCSALPTHAYEFSFHNNIEIPMGIAIQYMGIDNSPEPLYGQLVNPGSMTTFKPGQTRIIPMIKSSFCLDKIYYIENPTPAEKAKHFEKASSWKKIDITWVQEESTTKKKTKAPAPAGKTAAPAPSGSQHIKEKSKPTTLSEKSLCRERHFDIIRDEQQRIAITSSLAD